MSDTVRATASRQPAGSASHPSQQAVSVLPDAHQAHGPAFCPHCGYDLQRDGVISDGIFEYVPGDGMYLRGRRLRLTPQRHEMLGALMRQAGLPVSRSVLAERLGYEGDYSYNLIAVHLTHIRHALGSDNLPFENVHGVGVRWIGHPAHRATPLEAA